AISFLIFTPIPLTLCGIAAAPIAENQARKCELAHISIRLSKKQQLTRLFCKTDARSGCGGLIPHGWLLHDAFRVTALARIRLRRARSAVRRHRICSVDGIRHLKPRSKFDKQAELA